MKICLGADHAGFELKDKIREHLATRGVDVQDCGTFSSASVDYPDYARQACEAVTSGKADLAVLVCGTGIGMCIAANKVAGIRAAHVTSEIEAQLCREHNNANVITLGGRVLSPDQAYRIVDTWLDTKFAGGRHQHRLDLVTEIEREELKRLV